MINLLNTLYKQLKLLVKNDIKVAVSFTPTKKNFTEINDLLDLCLDLGVKSFRSQPLMIMGRGIGLKDYVLDEIQYSKLVEKINNAKINTKYKSLKIEWGDPINHMKLYSNFDEFKYDNITISAYGDIMLSPYLPVSVGNLRNHKINEYIDAGIEKIYTYRLVKDLFNIIDNWNEMQIKDNESNFPILGKDSNIDLDILSNTLDEKNLSDLLEKRY